jgi:hypothetical protein
MAKTKMACAIMAEARLVWLAFNFVQIVLVSTCA